MIDKRTVHINDEKNEFNTVIKYSQWEMIDFLETDLTYSGRLIDNVDSSIVRSHLKPIKNKLNKYVYFYDIESIFHFSVKEYYLIYLWIVW